MTGCIDSAVSVEDGFACLRTSSAASADCLWADDPRSRSLHVHLAKDQMPPRNGHVQAGDKISSGLVGSEDGFELTRTDNADDYCS